MPLTAQDAQRMCFLFQYGVISADEIIAWADAVIVDSEPPLPDALLELSTTDPVNTGEIMSCLHRLGAGSDFWSAFRIALPKVRDYVRAHPDRAEVIAQHLYLTACFADFRVPDDLGFVYRFDDAFSLARQGIYDTRDSVYRAFLDELDRVIISARLAARA